MSIIDRLLSILDEKSLKAADLCRFLDINTSTMTNWKKRGTDPPAKMIAPICEFLGVSTAFLLTGSEDSTASPEIISNGNIDPELLHLLQKLTKRQQIKLIGYVERMLSEPVAADPAEAPSGKMAK